VQPPDYPGAASFQQAKHYRTGQPGRSVAAIVFHITDGHERAQGTVDSFVAGEKETSAHFVIDQDGTIIQCVRLDDIAFHANAANYNTIGIEHCARSPSSLLSPNERRIWGPDNPGLPLSDAQKMSSAVLSGWLCQKYGLDPQTAIVGHTDIDKETTHGDCPYGVGNFNQTEYASLVQSPTAQTFLAQLLDIPLGAIDFTLRNVTGEA
jgi:N-acetyl-anhydromuramyl-L-alanine amidase AmpD